MPNFADMKQERNGKINVLAYGPSQTKKTTWVVEAVKAGYTVVLLAGERNYPISAFNKFTDEEKKRLIIIDCADGPEDSRFAQFICKLMKDSHVVWDDTRNMIAEIPAKKENNHFVLRTKYLTTNTVIGLDSWTSLQQSVIKNISKNVGIDLFSGEESDDKRSYYRVAGQILDAVLNTIIHLPCHVVVIGHSILAEQKKKNPADPKKEIILGYRTQPISSSNNHAMKIAKAFTECLFFNRVGTEAFIDVTATSERDGGSRIVPPRNYPYNDLSFKRLIEESGYLALPKTDVVDRGIEYIPAGGDLSSAFKATFTTTTQAAQTEEKKPAPVLDASATPSSGTPKAALPFLLRK